MMRQLVILLSLFVCVSNAKAVERPLFIPEGAFGVVQISDLIVGTLTLLKGIKGEGRYLTHNAQGDLCEVSPVRFLAGGFNGRTIGVEHGAEDIVIQVYSEEISERLMQAREVNSVDFPAARVHSSQAGWVVTAGLETMEAFILHPQPIWASWWRYQETQLPCRPIHQPPVTGTTASALLGSSKGYNGP